LRVSNAFETSIFIAILPPKLLLSRTFIASDANIMQSLIFLPLMNPFCTTKMMFGKILANLSARTLDIILNLKFERAIRLYCSIVSAL